MAAWQFDLYFIPSASSLPDTSVHGWEPSLADKCVYAIQEDLAHYFGPPWLMLEDWIVFGPENGNRIDLLFEEGAGASINIRIDTRDDAPQFLTLVADLARLQGCKFFSPETRELIEPDPHQVLAAINRWEARNLGLR
jgi:hypothetical protein